jgi:Na+-driven multidrug efflux pump
LPTIETLIVDSTYVVADGFFISNYIGAEAFAAEKSNLAEI